MTAAVANNVDILTLLLNRTWVDLEQSNDLDCARLLHVASEHDRLEVVQLLLSVSVRSPCDLGRYQCVWQTELCYVKVRCVDQLKMWDGPDGRL